MNSHRFLNWWKYWWLLRVLLINVFLMHQFMIVFLTLVLATANPIASPDERYEQWKNFAITRNSRSARKWFESSDFSYQTLAARFQSGKVEISQDDAVQIQRDMERSSGMYFKPTALYPELVLFSAEKAVFITSLTDLFHAYTVGPRSMTKSQDLYVQGMNSIAGSILLSLNLDKDRALRVFGLLLNNYGVYRMVRNDLAGLQIKFQVLKHLIQKHLPSISKRLFIDLNLDVQYFATSWFVTLFQHEYALAAEIRIKILDGFIQHGWPMIYCVALSILLHMRDKIVDGNEEEVFQLLTQFHTEIKSDIFPSAFMYLQIMQSPCDLENNIEETSVFDRVGSLVQGFISSL